MIDRIKNSNVLMTLLILIIVLSAFTIFFFVNKKSAEQNVVENDKEYFLAMYKCDDDSFSNVKSDTCSEELYKIPTETKNATFLNASSYITRYLCEDGTLSHEKNEYCSEVYDSIEADEDSNIISGYGPEYLESDFDLSNYVVYEDNGLKFYNNETQKITPLNLKGDYDYFDMVFNENYYEEDDTNSIDGIIFYQKNGNKFNCVYYDLIKEKEMYKNKYDFMEQVLSYDNEYLLAYKFDNNNEEKIKIYVISKKEEKEYFNVDSEAYINMSLEEDDKGDIWVLEEDNTTQFFTKDFKEITPKMTEGNYYYDYSDIIAIKRENNLEVYDLKGNLTNSYLIKGELKDIRENVYLTVVNNMLNIVDYEGNVLKEVCPWSINNKYYQENNWVDEEYYNNNDEDDMNGSYTYFSVYDISNNKAVQYRFEKIENVLISHDVKEIPFYMLEEE